MSRSIPLVAAALLSAVAASSAPAQTIFVAALTNAAEPSVTTPTTSTGAPRPASFGTAIFTLSADQTSLSFIATIQNIDFTGTQTADLNDNLTAAHIHASAAADAATRPVVWGFFGSPLNDNAPNDVVVSPFASGVGGTISGKWDLNEGNGTTLAAQLPNLVAGQAYINFHTTQFAGGEIRGAILVTPEPGSLLLVATGIGGLVAVGARTRREG